MADFGETSTGVGAGGRWAEDTYDQDPLDRLDFLTYQSTAVYHTKTQEERRALIRERLPTLLASIQNSLSDDVTVDHFLHTFMHHRSLFLDVEETDEDLRIERKLRAVCTLIQMVFYSDDPDIWKEETEEETAEEARADEECTYQCVSDGSDSSN